MMMKRYFTTFFIVVASLVAMAQEVKTYSVYDTNQSGGISVSDISDVVDKVKKNVTANSTQQYVTADDLVKLLQSIQSDLKLIKEKLGIAGSGNDSGTDEGESEDSPYTSEQLKVNINSNSNLYCAEKTLSESSTIFGKDVAMRLEMPQLSIDNTSLFLIHVLPTDEINYCLDYDCAKKASRWTAYQWHNGNSSSSWNRNEWRNGATYNDYGGNGDPFQPDPIIPVEYQVKLEDHTANGYDRGHMLGSADRLNSKEANGQTFYLSNMHPQYSGFNQGGIWYNLELFIRNSYNKSDFRDTLYVVKGGTIADDQIIEYKKGIPVPQYFYMAILCKNSQIKNMGGYKAIAFWMKHEANTDNNYLDHAISIDELEQKTGIDFFCNLPDVIENEVEASFQPTEWKLQ